MAPEEKRYHNYSIIVPSYNRQDEIKELLQSFTNLDFDTNRAELIIADDGSSDDTANIVQDYQNKISIPLRFLTQTNQGPGAARNMGIQAASGDFFIFIDSDCTIPRNWLKIIDEELHAKEADAYGGRDSFRPDFPVLLKAINYSMTSFISTGGLRGSSGKKLAKFYPRSFNMGLSRELYKKVGGFGSLRHGQDIEFSHRIIQSGARVIFIDQAVVFHKRRTSFRKFFRQVFNWGVARINLYKIHNAMLEPLHFAPAVATAGLMLLILASIFWPDFWKISRWIFLSSVLILVVSGIHAAVSYRSPRMIYLIPIIMPIQIIGYGIGFTAAFIYRVILNRPEFTGFQKRYYQ